MQFIKKIIFIFLPAFLFLIVASPKLYSITWSPPVDLKFIPPTININGNQNRSGNATITWLDIPSNNYVNSIYLLGAKHWTSPKILVSAASTSKIPAMGINANGYAVSTWISNGPNPTIQSAQFVNNAWVSLGTVAGPAVVNYTANSVDVDRKGNILTTFVQDNGDTTNTLFASTHNSNGWTSPQPLFTSSLNELIEEGISPTFDNHGNAVINWATLDTVNLTMAIYASNYIKADGTFTPFTQIFSGPGDTTNIFTAVSASGNAVLTWVVDKTFLYGSVFTPSTGWSPATLLSNQLGIEGILASINDKGNAVIANDSGANDISVSTYIKGIWSTEIVFTGTPGFSLFSPAIALDQFNNTLLIWSSFDTINNVVTIESSTRNGLKRPWSAPEVVPHTTPAGLLQAPGRLIITPSGLAALAILVAQPQPFPLPALFLDIKVMLGSNLFPPESAEDFSGKVIENRFLTQTEYSHHLTWSPSPSPTVTSYNLYRNGVLIAKIPAQNRLVFNDHNRPKNGVDRYTLIAISETLSSKPIVIRVGHKR